MGTNKKVRVAWFKLENTKKVSVSRGRIEKLEMSLKNIIRAKQSGCVWFAVKGIVSVVSQLISTQVVFGQEVRLRTGYLYFCILNRSSWNSFISRAQRLWGS